MFYSQLILAKKGALGTIWIAAHFDRKLHKKQIAETSISLSVDAILEPEAPIALRLSGHLLLGVVRVYSRKVNYLFNDCSDALVKIKQAFRPGAVDLPPEAATAPFYSVTIPENFDIDELEYLPGYGDSATAAGGKGGKDLHVTDPESITLAPKDVSWDFFDLGSQFDPEATFGEPVDGTRPLDEEEPDAPEKLRGEATGGLAEEPCIFSGIDDGAHMGGGLDEEMLPPMDESFLEEAEAPLEKARSAVQGQGFDVLPTLSEPEGTPLQPQEEIVTPLPAEREEEPAAVEALRMARDDAMMMNFGDALPTPPSTTGRPMLDSLPELTTPVFPEEQEVALPAEQVTATEEEQPALTLPDVNALPPEGMLPDINAPPAAEEVPPDVNAPPPKEVLPDMNAPPPPEAVLPDINAPLPEVASEEVQRTDGKGQGQEGEGTLLQTPVSEAMKRKRQPPAVEKKSELPKSTRKRKVVVDEDTTVIKGPVMRVQLVQTDDIRRVRKHAPHTVAEIRLLKMQASGVDPFILPCLQGSAQQLVGLFQRILGEGRTGLPRKRGAPLEPPLATPADKVLRREEAELLDAGTRSDAHRARERERQEDKDPTEEEPRPSPANEEARPERNGAEEEVEVLRGVADGAGLFERDEERVLPAVEMEERVVEDGGGVTEASPLQDIAGENGFAHVANGIDEPYQGGSIGEEELPEPPSGKPDGAEEREHAGALREEEMQLLRPTTEEELPGTGGAESSWSVPEETPARVDAAQKFADGLDFLADRGNVMEGEQAEDEDDYDDYGPGGPDKSKIPDGWSSRTRAVGKYLRGAFEGMGADATTKENQLPELGISQMLLGKTKREAARLYFEVLLLKTRDYIHITQSEPYGEILISGKKALMKSNL